MPSVSAGLRALSLSVFHSLPLVSLGGHDGASYLNSVECYEPKADQWSSRVAPTSCCRTSVGVAVLGGCVYAVGGQDGLSCLSLVEW